MDMKNTEATKVRWTPEVWAQTQPHNFYSHWPTASMTKCDFCGLYLKDHPAFGVRDEANVSLHPMAAIPGGLDPKDWPRE